MNFLPLPAMYRYFIHLAYNGTAYHGWQLQPNAVTVQQVLTDALRLILRFQVILTGCGRTDTGVHASCFYAHFETDDFMSAEDCAQLTKKLNNILPNDISLYSVFPVATDTHARFSASARSYEYRIARRKNPFTTDFSYRFTPPLDLERMNEGARIIAEYSDFSCFSKSHTQTHTNLCRITKAEWTRPADDLLVFNITADRFLRNMVRAIVGTLLEMGQAKLDAAGLRAIISSGNRCEAGQSMPARGLFLVQVEYPEGLLTYNPD